MTHRFHIGRALDGSLAGLPPVTNRLVFESCLGVVMSDELRLSLYHFWKLLLKQLRNLAVIMLSSTPQQRRVGGVLNQGVLKDVFGPGRAAALVEEFDLHQL